LTSLVLIRHGEAEANVTQIVGGPRGDTGLTARGRTQAERLRDRLAATREIEAHVLLASTLPRARQTAEILAPALGLPITLDDELHELRPGEADGLSMLDAMARFGMPDFARAPERPVSPGGESWSAFMARVAAAIARITEAHEGKTIVAVTHGGFVDGAFAHFLRLGTGLPPTQFLTRHASITHWQRRPQWNQTPGWALVTFNDAAHLRDLDAEERIPWAALGAKRA
jgi:probable phosphoglycerate mutase